MKTFLEVEAAVLARLDGVVEGENVVARRKRQISESMIAAAAVGHRHVVCLLIRGGADVNAKDRQEQTALMRAASRSDLKMTKLLLRLGSDVNARGLNGDTALNIAIRRGDEEVFNLLLRAGADIFLKKWDGRDAWDVAKAWKRTRFSVALDEAAAKWPGADSGDECRHLRRIGPMKGAGSKVVHSRAPLR
jgi:CO dehydrogenase/acetyl-CoA synthase delta subunit